MLRMREVRFSMAWHCQCCIIVACFRGRMQSLPIFFKFDDYPAHFRFSLWSVPQVFMTEMPCLKSCQNEPKLFPIIPKETTTNGGKAEPKTCDQFSQVC